MTTNRNLTFRVNTYFLKVLDETGVGIAMENWRGSVILKFE